MDKGLIKPHWSFWVISILGLIWNIMGCLNFIMQINSENVANFPEAAQNLINTRPFWATVAFGVAVFGGLSGDILLLNRKSFAIQFFLLSFAGIVVTNIHTASTGADLNIWIGSASSFVISIFYIWYTLVVKRKNWIAGSEKET